MKRINHALAVPALAAVFGLTYSARAQYKPVGDDGIAASPRMRQILTQSARQPAASQATQPARATTASSQATGPDSITASPRVRQWLESNRTVPSAVSKAVVAVGYRATGDDGVTASPTVRQRLNEQRGTIQIAPVK